MPADIRFVAKGKKGEIWLYDQVGDGWFGGMSAKSFIAELAKLGKVDTINLHINSPGGSVFDGVAIYNQLKAHPARIEVDVDGVAASIASVIAMAGDEIRMADGSMIMIHDPYTLAAGGAEEMRKTADLLDQIGASIATIYAKRTGLKESQIAAMMNEETWMGASAAIDAGFADRVTEELRVAASSNFDYSRFKHAPDKITSGTASAGHSVAQVKLASIGKRLPRS